MVFTLSPPFLNSFQITPFSLATLMLYNILPQCYIVLELFSRFNNVWLVNSNHPNYVGHEMSHLISSPQVISIIWLFSFLSASPWALFTKVLQKYCVFFSGVSLISRAKQVAIVHYSILFLLLPSRCLNNINRKIHFLFNLHIFYHR